jgi:hypothetical protein
MCVVVLCAKGVVILKNGSPIDDFEIKQKALKSMETMKFKNKILAT